MPQFTHQVINPQISDSMDIWARARTHMFLFLALSNVSSFDAAKPNLGQAEQHCILFVNMISFLYSTVQLILPYSSPSQISKSQSDGQKAYPVEVPMQQND
jgi:hypothetical protein